MGKLQGMVGLGGGRDLICMRQLSQAIRKLSLDTKHIGKRNSEYIYEL